MSGFFDGLLERYLRAAGWVQQPSGHWKDPTDGSCYELEQAELTQRLRDGNAQTTPEAT